MTTEATWPDYTTLPADGRKPRNEARVIVRVDVEPDTTMVCGRLLKRGPNTLLVYKSEVDAIRARTQGPEDLAILERAKANYQGALAQYARGLKLPVEKAEATFARPLQAFYYEAGGTTGLPPIKSLEVGPEAPPPESPEATAAQTNMTNAMLADALIKQGQVLAELLEEKRAREARRDAAKK